MSNSIRPPLSAVQVTPYAYPYQSSLSSSASSSTSSVFSVDALSQSSVSSTYSTKSNGSQQLKWDTENPWQTSVPKTLHRALPPIKTCDAPPIAPEQRQHPRRCSVSAQRAAPPTLTRQSERKGQFVECLVGEHITKTNEMGEH